MLLLATFTRAASRIKSRLSLRLAKILVGLLLVINVFVLSFSHFYGYKIIPAKFRDFSKSFNNDNNHPQQPVSNTPPVASSSFEASVKKKFKQVEDDPERFWLAKTDITEPVVDVEISHFLAEKETENSWINKPQLFYDPRFTFLMYLNEIKRRYRELDPSEGPVDSNKFDLPKLPFNWADWMDLTVLNEDLSKPLEQRMNCEIIRSFTNNDPDPSYFCFNNNNYTDEQISQMGFRRREQVPGFVIHSHSTHDDRPFNDIRILESKSYALTQHLPKPYKVVFLNGDDKGGTYEFEVDQNSNQRLASSPIVTEYIKSNGFDLQSIDDQTLLRLDLPKEFEDLKAKVTPRYLNEDDDTHKMYQVLRQQSDPKASRELELTPEMFNYHLSMIRNQIYFYENKYEIPLDQLSVQEKLYYNGLVECSNYDDKTEPTYFKMATIRIDDDRNRDREWGWHYDWRFFNGALNYDRIGWTERELTTRTNIILDRLLRNWNRFAEEKGIITWIMHGPLLSWYWDGLMFPFDVDIDIQMPAVELARLARSYNQTLVVEDPTEGYGRFLIDVGTYIHNRGISEKSNHIDARFVDVDSGIYIDITGLSKSKANTPEEYNDNGLANIEKGFEDDQVEIYNDRRKHFYKLEQLSPLRYSMLGGVPVFIPLTITDRLIFEYSKGLSDYEFHDWYFVNRLNLWLRKEQLAPVFDQAEVSDENGINRDKLLNKVLHMTDDQALQLLENDNILTEYYLTKEITDLHIKERQYLFDSLGRDNEELKSNQELRKKYNEFTAQFKMRKPIRKALYDYEHFDRLKHHK